MSDDEEYYEEDDDYFYWEEEPLDGLGALADDLCEHAVQSPVWQDGAADVLDEWSDWEYYSDDYYDQDKTTRPKAAPHSVSEEPPRAQLKRKRENEERSSKRTKVDGSHGQGFNVEDSSRTVVKWRVEDNEQNPPLVEGRKLESVALLRDWKERFMSVDSDSANGDGSSQPNERLRNQKIARAGAKDAKVASASKGSSRTKQARSESHPLGNNKRSLQTNIPKNTKTRAQTAASSETQSTLTAVDQNKTLRKRKEPDQEQGEKAESSSQSHRSKMPRRELKDEKTDSAPSQGSSRSRRTR
ncbi:MAG: hypothetical protein M1833_001633 [Piccolia ochrophora]|nr:MAG: hypothetical protein M1833_001633 [Piccolia ochrophora]